MRRHTRAPRAHWRATVESQGLTYAVGVDDAGRPQTYWDETVFYEFTLAEVEQLEEVVTELHLMCETAAEHIVAARRFADVGITDPAVAELVARSWRDRARSPSIYGRFDLHYHGDGPAKLLEYNADTPTSLLETAGVQWFWMEELFPSADQWNSVHERLVDAWWRSRHLVVGDIVHFGYSLADTEGEDCATTAYLAECAQQAGLTTVLLPMEEVGWDRRARRFVDGHNQPIRTMFKLYPWEWMVSDRFGPHLLDLGDEGPQWIEPPWKMLWSTKALLAVLWELFPGHPNLLPAYLDGPRELVATGYAAKPLHGREGAGITLVGPDGARLSQSVLSQSAIDATIEGPVCYQALHPLPDFDGNHPVLGAWVIEGQPAGLGMRESRGLITDTSARFVPHIVT